MEAETATIEEQGELDTAPKNQWIPLTDAEKMKVAAAAVEQITERGLEIVGIDQKGLPAILRDAMVVLPVDRRRHVTSRREIERLGLWPFVEQRIAEVATTERHAEPKTRKKRESHHRVIWTLEEVERVMVLAVNRMRSMGMGTIPTEEDRTGRRIMLDAIRSAQNQMLSSERRRNLASHFNLNRYDLMALERNMKAPAPAKTEETTPVVETSSGTVTPFAPVATANTDLNQASLEFVNYIARMGNALAEAQELNKMLQEDIDKLAKVQEEHSKRMAALENRTIESPTPKEKHPVVALLGMRKDEFDTIQAEVLVRKLKVDLKLYEQDEKPRPIKAEFAITMKFINHAWNDHITDAIPNGQYTFLRGGTSQVIQQLEIWFG